MTKNITGYITDPEDLMEYWLEHPPQEPATTAAPIVNHTDDPKEIG